MSIRTMAGFLIDKFSQICGKSEIWGQNAAGTASNNALVNDQNKLEVAATLTGSLPAGTNDIGNVQISGNNVIDYFSGTVNVTKNYAQAMGISIANDGTSDLTFTVHEMTITVKSGEAVDENFAPFTTLTVTTTVPFRAIVRG